MDIIYQVKTSKDFREWNTSFATAVTDEEDSYHLSGRSADLKGAFPLEDLTIMKNSNYVRIYTRAKPVESSN
jgi:hypothetical protein